MFYSSYTSPTELARYFKAHSPLFAEDIEAWKPVRDKVKSYLTEEKNGSCKLEVEVPGYSSENIAVVSKKGKLLINIQNEGKVQKELEFSIANKFDSSNITAKCKNGILTILLPLRAEENPVTIPVL